MISLRVLPGKRCFKSISVILTHCRIFSSKGGILNLKENNDSSTSISSPVTGKHLHNYVINSDCITSVLSQKV